MKKILLIGLICLFSFDLLHAQIMEGRNGSILPFSVTDTIRFNPEQPSITEPGFPTPIVPGRPGFILSIPGLTILQDFSEYLSQDSTRRILPLDRLPSYVTMRTGLGKIYQQHILRSFSIHESDRAIFRQLDLLNFQPFFDPVYSIRILEGGVGTRFSAEDILRMIFWKSERSKIHNRRYATAYKFYNLLPME